MEITSKIQGGNPVKFFIRWAFYVDPPTENLGEFIVMVTKEMKKLKRGGIAQ